MSDDRPSRLDWQGLNYSYHDGIAMHREDLMAQRRAGSFRLYTVPGRRDMVRADQLDDDEIESLALFLSETDMNYMLNRKARLNQ